MKMSHGNVAEETNPLHQAIRANRPTGDILHLIDKNPMAAQLRLANGRYPLHEACEHNYGIKVNVIMKLLEVFPQAAQYPDAEGWYPLHIACLHYFSFHDRKNEDVILRLIEAHPEAAAVLLPDGYGRCYALHIACQERYDDVIMKLLELFPLAAYFQDVTGQCPLHIACRYKKSDEVILKLIEINPDVIAKKVHNPLQLLASDDDNVNVVEYLLQFPDLDVNATNHEGNSALHIAINCTSFDIVDALLRHPFIIIDQRNHDNETPYDLLDKKISELRNMDDDYYRQRSLLKYQEVKQQLVDHLVMTRWGSFEYFYQNGKDWSMNQ